MAVTLPIDLCKAGRLREAINAVQTTVKKNPGETMARWFLAELLCFTGDLERADRLVDAVSVQDPSLGVAAAIFRQLLVAEQARQQFFTEGRVPEFNEEPNERIKLMLRASIAVREKNGAEAARLLAEADEMRPRLSGTCDDRPFDDIRDLDDLTASVLEVLTPAGKYYWVPFERLDEIEFRPHERQRDVLWRKAKVVLKGGVERELYLPCLYPGSHAAADEQLALGQGTEWRGGEGEPVRGVGHRMLLVGDDAVPFLELNRLKFAPTAGEGA